MFLAMFNGNVDEVIEVMKQKDLNKPKKQPCDAQL